MLKLGPWVHKLSAEEFNELLRKEAQRANEDKRAARRLLDASAAWAVRGGIVMGLLAVLALSVSRLLP